MLSSPEELRAEVDRLCVASGLTKEELAQLAGIKVGTLSKILGGHQKTSPLVINSLRNAARVIVLEKNIPAGEGASFRDEAQLKTKDLSKEDLAEVLDFNKAFALVAETMSARQLLLVAKKIAESATVSQSAKVVWLKILMPWLDVRLEQAEREEKGTK
jgi:transcriptional regulator with XRE-family HTH domain